MQYDYTVTLKDVSIKPMQSEQLSLSVLLNILCSVLYSCRFSQISFNFAISSCSSRQRDAGTQTERLVKVYSITNQLFSYSLKLE